MPEFLLFSENNCLGLLEIFKKRTQFLRVVIRNNNLQAYVWNNPCKPAVDVTPSWVAPDVTHSVEEPNLLPPMIHAGLPY